MRISKTALILAGTVTAVGLAYLVNKVKKESDDYTFTDSTVDSTNTEPSSEFVDSSDLEYKIER